MKRIGLVLLGIVLILLGLRGTIIGMFGTNTTAVITGSKQIISKTSKMVDKNYLISYTFNDVSGKKVTGSYKLSRVYDSTKLPTSGNTLSVRYFKFYSGFSKPSGSLAPGFSDLLSLVIGVFVLFFAQRQGRIKISM